jgi:hypothetical protein
MLVQLTHRCSVYEAPRAINLAAYSYLCVMSVVLWIPMLWLDRAPSVNEMHSFAVPTNCDLSEVRKIIFGICLPIWRQCQ